MVSAPGQLRSAPSLPPPIARILASAHGHLGTRAVKHVSHCLQLASMGAQVFLRSSCITSGSASMFGYPHILYLSTCLGRSHLDMRCSARLHQAVSLPHVHRGQGKALRTQMSRRFAGDTQTRGNHVRGYMKLQDISSCFMRGPLVTKQTHDDA